MPNYCSNRVRFKFSSDVEKAVVDQIIQLCLGEGGTFTLDRLCPRPPELDIESSSVGDDSYLILHGSEEDWRGRHAYLQRQGIKFSDSYIPVPDFQTREAFIDWLREAKHRGFNEALGNQYHENMQKHGARTWYQWAINNWGTKWDVCDKAFPYESVNGQVVDFEFTTAWSPPVEALQHFVSREDGPYSLLPKGAQLEILLDYAEPGCNFMGRVVWTGPKIDDSTIVYDSDTNREEANKLDQAMGDDWFYLNAGFAWADEEDPEFNDAKGAEVN